MTATGTAQDPAVPAVPAVPAAQITFRHLEPSPALRARIERLVARLHHLSPRLLDCRVTVCLPPQHQVSGGRFEVDIDLHIPGAWLPVHHAHAADGSHADAYVAVRDAFRAARRKLLDYEREHHHSVHTP